MRQLIGRYKITVSKVLATLLYCSLSWLPQFSAADEQEYLVFFHDANRNFNHDDNEKLLSDIWAYNGQSVTKSDQKGRVHLRGSRMEALAIGSSRYTPAKPITSTCVSIPFWNTEDSCADIVYYTDPVYLLDSNNFQPMLDSLISHSTLAAPCLIVSGGDILAIDSASESDITLNLSVAEKGHNSLSLASRAPVHILPSNHDWLDRRNKVPESSGANRRNYLNQIGSTRSAILLKGELLVVLLGFRPESQGVDVQDINLAKSSPRKFRTTTW